MRKPLKNYFIPHDGNDFKPHSLQRTAVVMMSLLVLLTFALANMQALLWMNSNWLVGTILPSIIVELTNESRDGEALGSLQRNTTLDQAAQLKAEHMAQYEYFAHYAPDGTSPWYFFDSVSYNYLHAGENLAVHFSDSDEVVDAWLASPSHRANILNGKYTEIGVGTARGEYQGYPTVYVVQLFGTPMTAAPAPVAVAEPPQQLALATDVTPESVVVPIEPVPALEVESVSASEPITDVAIEPPVIIESETLDLILSNPQDVAEEVVATESVPVNDTEPVILVSDIEETTQAVAGIDIVGNIQQLEQQPVSSVAKLATQPQKLLNIVYLMTSIFVIGALMLSIFVEVRRQHPVQIAYGTGLLAAMAALMYIHLAVTSGALIA